MPHHPIICLKCKHHLYVEWEEAEGDWAWLSLGTKSKFCEDAALHERGRAAYTIPDIEPASEDQEAEEYNRDIDHLWRNR
jgi:hypothetical protein